METFNQYDPGDFYDELIDDQGRPRPGAKLLVDKIESLPNGDLALRQKAAEALLLKMGITFNVYGREEGTEKIFPFDIIPRIVSSSDWSQIESGLKQRIYALNQFIQDIYNEKKILKDKVVPEELILSSRTYRRECEGFTPPRGIWCHVTGTDLVRDRDGRFYVLEDNLRCPSGVSYVLENRQVLKRTFPQVFEASRVRPVDDYPAKLFNVLSYLAPSHLLGLLALATLSYVLRAVRAWDALRAQVGGRFLTMLRITVLHTAANNLLPMRLGEAAFPLLVRRHYGLRLTRGANVASFTMPRILYTQGDVHLPGRHDRRIVQRVEFTALGSEDGLTAPITLA